MNRHTVAAFGAMFILSSVAVVPLLCALLFPRFFIAAQITSVAVALFAVSRSELPEYRLSWLALSVILPIVSVPLCFFLKRRASKSELEIFAAPERSNKEREIPQSLGRENAGIARALLSVDPFARLFEGGECKYYGDGGEMLSDMLRDLGRAKRYIYVEYYIIAEGEVWQRVCKVLKERAAAGVDVRVMYDDVGSMRTLPTDFAERLSSEEISCRAFYKVSCRMSKHNNRDHRKLLVIDGEIAYTGGLNLSDEYVNLVELYGRWKDSGVRICGECASRFADMFLSLWRLNSERSAKRKDRHVLQSSVKAENAITSEASASSIYIESSKGVRGESSGALVPFGTAPRPFFKRSAGRELFLNIINGAVDHIYLTTPYFIPDSELLGALGRAAARGVDVRIVIPGVPDKRLIKWIGEGYFPALIGAGVRIYEYSPGFIHSKCIVCDGRSAVVGSLNLDYRSLAHNFENGVLIMENGAVAAARDDVLSTVSISHELSLCDLHPSLIKRAARLIAGVVLPIL